MQSKVLYAVVITVSWGQSIGFQLAFFLDLQGTPCARHLPAAETMFLRL